MWTTHQARIGVIAVVAVAIAASLAGLRNEFVQDDIVLIVENTWLHANAAMRAGAPPGSLEIRIRTGSQPR